MAAGRAWAAVAMVLVASATTALAGAPPSGGATPIITTFAGPGTTSLGDGGPATSARIERATGTAVGPDGSVYIADASDNRVRRVAPDGTISTVAGTGTGGSTGDGGPATAAQLHTPWDVAVHRDGTIYVSEYTSHRIRRIDPTTRRISTYAGTGTGGYNGDGGLATASQVFHPAGLALDAAGDLFIADMFGHRIREVVRSTGRIRTAAGTGLSGSNDDGPIATTAVRVPIDLALDAAGTIYVAEYSYHRIRRIDPTAGTVTTIAGTYDVPGSSGDGGSGVAALVNLPAGIAVDGAANVYISDTGNRRVRRIESRTGRITTVAGNGTTPSVAGPNGDGGPATAAAVGGADGLTVTPGGALLIAVGTRVRRVSDLAVPPVGGDLAPHQRLVIAAHHDFLDRDPTATELTTHSTSLGSGAQTRRGFIGILASSPEWVGTVVDRMYRDTLGRPGDPAGVAFWVGEIRSGRRSVARVAADLYASPEYYSRVGGTLPLWVDELYRALLGRPADATGRAYWVDRAARAGRVDVALTFFQGEESARVRVGRLYVALLGRGGDAAGIAHWVPRVQAHGDIVLATDLASSTEYLTRAQRRFP